MIIKLREVSSTNSYLKKHFDDFPNYTFVYTENQTDGKGRESKKWTSYPDSLTGSLLIKEDIGIPFELLPLFAAKVIHIATSEYVDGIEIKWPNDLLYQTKKVSGILCEGISYGEDIKAIIIGFGVNMIKYPKGFFVKATSLYNINKVEVNIDKFIARLIELFKTTSRTDVVDYVNNHLAYKNSKVLFLHKNETNEGTIIKVNDDGSLRINTNDGNIDVLSGEVKIVR